MSNTNICGDYCDPDGDGIVNFQEYAFQLHPTQYNSEGRPVPDIQAGYLTMSYRQNKDATDVDFITEVTGSLASNTWEVSGLVETARSDSNTFWSVTVRDSQPVEQSNERFMRLKLNGQ
jgi:hypothetical protein